MAKNVVDKDLGYAHIVRELQSAGTAIAEIGIHADAQADGLSIAEYGAYNEYGTSKIPERSFMRSTFDEQIGKVQRQIDAQYALLVSGKTTVYRALMRVGQEHAEDIKMKIRSGVKPENSPVTIARKKSSRTLIDTDAMLQSITATVKKV